jgi:hypothetical protein
MLMLNAIAEELQTGVFRWVTNGNTPPT